MKKILCITLVSASVLASCVDQSQVVSSERTDIKVQVVKVKKPKHFNVVVEDLSTGRYYKLRSSKHCSEWNNIKVGQTYKLVKYTISYDDGTKYYEISPRACELARSSSQWSID